MTQRLSNPDHINECNRRREEGLFLFTGPTTRYNSQSDRHIKELGGTYDRYKNGYLLANWDTWIQAASLVYPDLHEAIHERVESLHRLTGTAEHR